MASIFRTPLLPLLGAVLVVTLTAGLCGDGEPTRIRTATIGGVTGPVYYSVVDGSYRPVGHAIGKHAPNGERMAEALPLQP